MATLVSKTSGNFTAASTWAVADSATLLDSEASSSNLSNVWSAAANTFTPGAITCDGVGVKILNKINTASGFFGVRVVPKSAISSVTIGNPGTITTATPHGMSTGDTVTISGTTVTPAINNTYSITVTGANTFTIPINITAVTVGTGTVQRNVTSITSNSVAAATVITTGTHGLVSGTSITIYGNTGSVPSINGTYTITVTGTNTFTIPVTTTVGGTGGFFHINSGSPNTTVAVAASDIPTPGTGNTSSCSGWFFFKFPSNVTFNAGTTYVVELICTTANNFTVYTNGTVSNWSRFLRTTTTQAPVASDVLYVCGEYIGPGSNSINTVTMNNTAATVFGKMEISGNGLLSYGTSASTAYQLICNGNVLVNGAGEFRIGTSGSSLPATSTAVLQINQGGVNVTNGFLTRGTGIIQTWGNNKVWRTTLNGNVSAAATSLTTTDVTGWSSGEDIVIASTTRTNTETELKTLAVNSSGNTVTVPALSFAHGGSGDIVAEVANITRNIKIRGESTTIQAYMQSSSDGTINCNDTELQFMGSATANKRGFDVFNIVGGLGSLNLKECVFKNFEVASSIAILLNQATQTNCTLDGCIFYRCAAGLQTGATATTGVTITNCWGFGAGFGSVLFNLSMQGGTFTNCRAIGSTTTGVTISNIDNLGLTINNIIAHSNATAGISFGTISNRDTWHSFTNLTSWRNTTRGVILTSCYRTSIDGIVAFGNVTDGLEIASSILVDINNATLNGGTTQVQPFGILFGSSNTGITINNTVIGNTSAHTTSSLVINTTRQYHDIALRNCLVADTTEMTTQTNLTPGSFVGSSKHDQTNGTHKMWRKYGTITSDSVFTVYPPLSVRNTPTNALYKLNNIERKVAVPSGKAAKIGVYVRRSVVGDGTAYNGNLPRLILKENTAAGVTVDTVLATASVASLGSFELLLGTTPVALTDTVFNFYIDCNGTTGWINSDHWKIEVINGGGLTTNVNNESFWVDGLSAKGINTLLTNNSNTDTYWMDGYPAQDLFPISNSQMGRFFLLFDE